MRRAVTLVELLVVMDGSVRFVPETISPVVWRAAGARAGQEPMLIPYE